MPHMFARHRFGAGSIVTLYRVNDGLMLNMGFAGVWALPGTVAPGAPASEGIGGGRPEGGGTDACFGGITPTRKCSSAPASAGASRPCR